MLRIQRHPQRRLIHVALHLQHDAAAGAAATRTRVAIWSLLSRWPAPLFQERLNRRIDRRLISRRTRDTKLDEPLTEDEKIHLGVHGLHSLRERRHVSERRMMADTFLSANLGLQGALGSDCGILISADDVFFDGCE